MLKENRNLLIIALIALVNMLGYGIVIPILYAYSKHFGLSDFQNGLLFASFSICQFIATPIIGRMSDKYGRRPLLLISITGTAVSFLLMAFAQNSLWLFAARMLDGITAGNIPVAFAVISDSTEVKDRPRAFGIVGAAFSFGFVFGPAISALTLGLGSSVPFLFAAAVTIIAIVLTALYLPETNKHRGEVSRKNLFDFSHLWHALFDPNIGSTFVISLIYFLAFSCAIIYGFQPFTMHVLHVSAQQNAILFTLFGVVGLISQTFLVQRFAKMFGQKKAFAISFLLTAIVFFVMYLAKTLYFFVGVSLILGFVNSVAQTLIPSILSQEADAKSQGSIMGLNSSYQSIGMIIGPILGGFVATIAVPLPFLIGSILAMICFFLAVRIITHKEAKETAF
ncbi:MAG TPA: MFS transporter [Patescibacteria group bacterium]|nr:MFS transporter [Patescibacteria group bacterium]